MSSCIESKIAAVMQHSMVNKYIVMLFHVHLLNAVRMVYILLLQTLQLYRNN